MTLHLPASRIPDEHFRRVVSALVEQWRDQSSSTPTLDGVASHARCVEDAEPAGPPGTGRFGNQRGDVRGSDPDATNNRAA